MQPNIFCFIGEHMEHIAGSPSQVYVLALLHRKNHVPYCNNGRMGGYGFVRYLLELPRELQVRLAGFEEHFYAPSFAIKLYDLLFGQTCVSAKESNPLFSLRPVPHVDNARFRAFP